MGEKQPAGNVPFAQVFDLNGFAFRQADSRGNITSIAYDTPSNAVSTVTDPLSNKTVQAHADRKNLTAETDPSGKTTTYAYDSHNRVTLETDRSGNQTATTYHDPSGNIASVVDALGAATSVTYLNQTQGSFNFDVPAKIAYADSSSVAFTYDASGNVLTYTDQAGKVTRYTRNTRGQILIITNASGGVTTYVYSPDGTAASVRTPSGDTTQLAYDQQKRPITTTFADGSTATTTYDVKDHITQENDERGKSRNFAYDDNGQLRIDIDALGRSVSTTYDTDNRPASITDRLGKASLLTYDELGRAKTFTNRANEITAFSYDAVSRLSSIADANGKLTRFTWDSEGAPSTVTDALSRTFSATVDKLHQITALTTPLLEKSTFAYDKLGRLISETNPLSQALTYNYDVRGLLAGIALPAGVSATYARTELGSVSGITDPNGNLWSSSFDSSDRLASTTDPLGRATAYGFDNRSRVVSQTTPAGSAAFTYDPAGNILRQLFSDGTDLQYTYDNENRMLTGNSLTLAYDANGSVSASNGITIARDAEGRLSTVTYAPGITVTYSYNNVGLLAAVNDWVGGATKFTWDDAHQLTSMTRPNGTVTSYTYDKNGSLVGTAETTADGASSIALHRDAAGKVISADRNIPQFPSMAGGVLPLSYDAAHQMSGATYDGEGRLLSDGLRSYTWDLASRLSGYSGVDGTASFTYDGFGMRVSRTTPDATVNYVLNYANTLPSVSIVQSGGSDLRYYVYLPGGVLLHSVEAADNTRHFYHFDETGSTMFLTDDSGSVSDSYGISPFGETVSQTGATDNPFTYSGAFGVMQEGATSLYYMRARYYDSAPARFLSKDPVASLDPLEINPYQFARNNPMEFVDPLGAQVDLTRYYDHGAGFINEDGTPEYRPYTPREKELLKKLPTLHKPLRHPHPPLEHWTSPLPKDPPTPLPEEHWTTPQAYWRHRLLQERIDLGSPPLPPEKPKPSAGEPRKNKRLSEDEIDWISDILGGPYIPTKTKITIDPSPGFDPWGPGWEKIFEPQPPAPPEGNCKEIG